MASLYKTVGKRGTTWTVEFFDSNRVRKRLRLGQMDKRQAESVKLRVELLVSAKITGTAPDMETSQWLAARDKGIRDKLADVGLTEASKSATLGPFLDEYISTRQGLVMVGKLSERTLGIDKLTRDCLCDCFGSDKPLRDINRGDASGFRAWLLTSGGRPVKRCGSAHVVRTRKPLDEGTVRKRCSIASRFFRYAKDHDLTHGNPFDSVPKANMARDKKAFINDSDARRVLAELPDCQWKLLFALARWGGLRVGSEVRELTWRDIDWERQRILVRSPKTKHHEGREARLVPMFPELMSLLSQRFEEAAEGDVKILPMLERKTAAALRDPVFAAITRAGLDVWPKLWINLRSTRETELTETYPMKTVCAWIGNSEAVASKHYLQVPDDHYSRATSEQAIVEMLRRSEKAAQKAAQQLSETRGNSENIEERSSSNSLDVCNSSQGADLLSSPGGIRTPDQGIMSPLL
jgi:hypothetical protein